jgi:hypothetical protein
LHPGSERPRFKTDLRLEKSFGQDLRVGVESPRRFFARLPLDHALALATASVGIAIGSGTGVAVASVAAVLRAATLAALPSLEIGENLGYVGVACEQRFANWPKTHDHSDRSATRGSTRVAR